MQSIVEYLLNGEKNMPEKSIVSDSSDTWSYGKLYEEAKKIAAVLQKKHLRQQPVIIFTRRNVQTIANIMGVLLSGNIYVPVCVKFPVQRIKAIAEKVDSNVLLCGNDDMDKACELCAEINIEVINVDKLQSPENLHDSFRLPEFRKEEIAYILFTSGSTGAPKGAAVSHKAIMKVIEWGSKMLDITQDDRLASQSPPYFSMFMFDLFVSVRNGMELFFIPDENFSNPKQLMNFLNRSKITMIYWVPMLFTLVAYSGVLSEYKNLYLNKILFSGEVIPSRHINIWRRCFPEATFVNMYGTTEVADICCYYILDREYSNEEKIPIGYPCKGMKVILVDDNGKLVRPDENDKTGEIYVLGDSIANGYYNEPEKTTQSFVQNPINDNYIELAYKTGDIAYYNESRELVFVSRKDFQIKHMGCRVELGEIEMLIYRYFDNIECCCVYDDKRKKIILFYSGAHTSEELREIAVNHLPEYMFPARYVYMDILPKNYNNKINRSMLQSMI